ncbi:MAG: hypothetical protein MUO21_09180 [Nitrososphaeraceae archaeon]|nr:hypothetical protein [Nitrososphaeraceae archaeon]
MIFLISYGITLNLKNSIYVSFTGVLLLSLLSLCGEKYESFDEEKITEDDLINEKTLNVASTSNTKDVNEINENLDLDKLLLKNNIDIEEENKKIEGTKTLDDLQSLLDKARTEGILKSGKKTSEYTPAEAQRATYNLIDATQQLNDTIEQMGPTLKSGMKIMEMMNKFK